MRKTLIYCMPEHNDIAKKLQDNYIAHQKQVHIISKNMQDDIEYAREKKYDEAIFIEDPDVITIHDIKSGYTNRCPITDVYYQ